MSTRSRIAIAIKNGEHPTYKSIYCHSDGYPEGVGEMLRVHYKTKQKIKRLMKRGDLSYLDKNVGSNNRMLRLFSKRASFAYRDRGETHTDAKVAVGIDQLRKQAQNCWAEYLYIWHDKRGWLCEEVEWSD